MGERLVCTQEVARSNRVRSTRPLSQILLASGAGVSAALMLIAGLNAVLVTVWLVWPSPQTLGLSLEAGAGFWWLLTLLFAALTLVQAWALRR